MYNDCKSAPLFDINQHKIMEMVVSRKVFFRYGVYFIHLDHIILISFIYATAHNLQPIQILFSLWCCHPPDHERIGFALLTRSTEYLH